MSCPSFTVTFLGGLKPTSHSPVDEEQTVVYTRGNELSFGIGPTISNSPGLSLNLGVSNQNSAQHTMQAFATGYEFWKDQGLL